MDPKILKLSNGITLIIDHMPQIESVSLRVLCKAGSRYETPDNAGIAHCIEHMNFKGTIRRSAKQIAEEFDMIGGYLNAYTGRERTVYYAKVLKDDLPLAADVLSDIMYNSVYDPDELKKEKNVILQEIAEAHDNPDDALFDMMQESLYPNSSMGKPIAGSKESVLSLTKQKIVAFLDSFYQSNNTIIGISGNFTETQLLDLIESKLANNTAPASERSVINMSDEQTKDEAKRKDRRDGMDTNFKRETDKPTYHGGDTREVREIEQAHLILAFDGASYRAEDYYIQQVAALIAGGGMSSRLFQEIREKRGLAYSIGAFCSSYTDCGIWGVSAVTGNQDLNELITVTIEQLLELTIKIDEDELRRAKVQIKSGVLMAQESSSSRAERIISNYAIFDRFLSLDEIMEYIDAIDIAMVAQKIGQIIKGSRISVAGLGNIKSMMDYDVIANKLRG